MNAGGRNAGGLNAGGLRNGRATSLKITSGRSVACGATKKIFLYQVVVSRGYWWYHRRRGAGAVRRSNRWKKKAAIMVAVWKRKTTIPYANKVSVRHFGCLPGTILMASKTLLC